MTQHEQYKLAFSVLHSDVTPEQVKQHAERKKGAFTMKRKLVPILIGAILVVLLGAVTAAELHTHWLSSLLGNVESHPEIDERVKNVGVSETVDSTTWTIDHLLVEGRIVFWQLTKTRTDGTPVEPLEDGEMAHLVVTDADGNDFGVGFGITMRRLDDGSDPSTCTLLYQAEMSSLRHFGEDFNGAKLYLAHMVEGEPIEVDGILQTPYEPVVHLETTIQPFSLRQTVIADGTGLNVGRLSLELQGIALLGDDCESAAVMADGGCTLVLKDGRELPVQFALQIGSELPEDEQWQIGALPEIIDPQDAAALRIGDTLYPIKDK